MTKTEKNLREALRGESEANRRYLYFASKAEGEGKDFAARVFQETASSETGHAFGHLEYLEGFGDPETGMPFGRTEDNVRSAIAQERQEGFGPYPGMAKTARVEGFEGVADWFETLARAKRAKAGALRMAVKAIRAPGRK